VSSALLHQLAGSGPGWGDYVTPDFETIMGRPARAVG